MENDNITLRWTYTLNGAPLDDVEVIFTLDPPSLLPLRVARYRNGGTTQVASEVQDRFVFNLTDSQSIMTILRCQRSDTGTYELRVSPDVLNQAAVTDEVKISVKCKCNIFLYFLVETWTVMIITIIIIIIMIIIMITSMRLMIFTLRLVVL